MLEDFDFGEVLSSYSRRQAIEDGVLVCISGPDYEGDPWMPDMCRELGFKFPIAVTAAVFRECIELTSAAVRACNDMRGRLWDVLFMLKLAIRHSQGDTVLFEYRCVTKSTRPSRVRLKSICGPGDDAEPVLTIMFPDED